MKLPMTDLQLRQKVQTKSMSTQEVLAVSLSISTHGPMFQLVQNWQLTHNYIVFNTGKLFVFKRVTYFLPGSPMFPCHF